MKSATMPPMVTHHRVGEARDVVAAAGGWAAREARDARGTGDTFGRPEVSFTGYAGPARERHWGARLDRARSGKYSPRDEDAKGRSRDSATFTQGRYAVNAGSRSWPCVRLSEGQPPDWRRCRAAVLECPSHPGAVAQLVARLVRNEKVRGSTPLSSTETRRPAKAGLCAPWSPLSPSPRFCLSTRDARGLRGAPRDCASSKT